MGTTMPTYGNPWTPWTQEVSKSANYSVLLADTGNMFTTAGAANITFTLPSLVNGAGGCWWFLNLQNNNMIITAPAGKLMGDNAGVVATTATFSTAGAKIGAKIQVWMNQAGTFYYAHVNGGTVAWS